jgi:hypothetical protein
VARDLRAEANIEAQGACNQAIFYKTYKATPRYNPDWAAAGIGEPGLQGLANTCVDRAITSGAGPINVDEVIRNPDAAKDRLFLLVTDISQFDAATGQCSFRGAWDNTDHEYSFDYAGDNALFASGDADHDCPALAGVDQNDVVRVWVVGKGSMSYDTQIGGSTTVPLFDVLKTQIIRKA